MGDNKTNVSVNITELVEETNKKVDAGTITRTAVLALAFVNSGLQLVGWDILPFDSEELSEVISYGFTAVAAIWAWWKNNSFTKTAIVADLVKEEVKMLNK